MKALLQSGAFFVLIINFMKIGFMSEKEAAKVIQLFEEKAEQKIAQKKDVFMNGF